MKKFYQSFIFLTKAAFLILILLIGWAYIQGVNLFKGKKTTDQGTFLDGWGVNDAHADAVGGGGSGGCPHVAVFSGTEFKIDNDFLLGKPKSFFSDANLIRLLYEHSRIGPDLLKFSLPLVRKNGRLAIQLQEIEEEETFVDSIKLLRVIHPASAHVFVDSSFEKYHVLDNAKFSEKTALPVSITHKGEEIRNIFSKDIFNSEFKAATFERGTVLELAFANLMPGKPAHFFVQSRFRDWMMGRDMTFSVPQTLRSPLALRAAMFVAGAIYLALGNKASGGIFATIPFFFGMGQEKSIIFSYKTKGGSYKKIVVHEPRDWRSANEAITFPKEAIRSDGSMTIKAEFTKRHQLGFAGVLQDPVVASSREEVLSVTRATHSRLQDVTNEIAQTNKSYTHLIPGDTVEVEFSEPNLSPNEGEQTTYLMQSYGFYTALREPYRKIAGDWQSSLSSEAKSHYEQLTSNTS